MNNIYVSSALKIIAGAMVGGAYYGIYHYAKNNGRSTMARAEIWRGCMNGGKLIGGYVLLAPVLPVEVCDNIRIVSGMLCIMTTILDTVYDW